MSDGVKLLRNTASTSEHPPSHLSYQYHHPVAIVAALVLSRLHYGNGTQVGRPPDLSCRCKTQQRDWYSVSVDLTTSRMHSSASIGFECLKGLFSRLPCRLIRLSNGDARSIYGSSHRSPTSDLNKDCMRSSFSDDLLVPAIRLPWMLPLPCRRRSCINDLPVDVTSAPSLHTFRKRLTLHLLDFPVLA